MSSFQSLSGFKNVQPTSLVVFKKRIFILCRQIQLVKVVSEKLAVEFKVAKGYREFDF